MTSKNWPYPPITFTHSLEMEARRVIYLTASLAQNSFYYNKGFLILPHSLPKVETAQCIIPDLDFVSIPHYWSQVAKLKLTTPIDAPKPLIDSVSHLLAKHYDKQKYTKHISSLTKSFEPIQEQFWNNLFTLFPRYKDQINSLTIYSTQYGPFSTFNLANQNNGDLIIYLRQDSSVDRLLWTILACLFRQHMENNLNFRWEEIESVVDWLMSESAIACGITLTHPTIKNLRANQIAKYRETSESYLAKLGFSPTYSNLQIPNLSPNDQKLFNLLLAARGKTITYETIAQTLWPDNNDWSLYAMSQAIARLRKKITASGITRPTIHASRKVGYSLI